MAIKCIRNSVHQLCPLLPTGPSLHPQSMPTYGKSSKDGMWMSQVLETLFLIIFYATRIDRTYLITSVSWLKVYDESPMPKESSPASRSHTSFPSQRALTSVSLRFKHTDTGHCVQAVPEARARVWALGVMICRPYRSPSPFNLTSALVYFLV